MIYVLYMFLLISILIVLHKCQLISFNQIIPALSYYTSKPNALEHEDLLTLFDKFNYKHDDGTCHGFTLTWAQEAALGLDQQFYNRLNLIKREKTTLPNKLQAITEKIKLSQALSKKEKRLNEIKPFLEALCLAQSPDDYHEIYAQTIQQSDIDIIYKMIQLNLGKNKDKVKNLFSKTINMASKGDVNRFLHELNYILTIKNQVAVVCGSEEHTVGFKKIRDNMWLFMDINQLYEQSEEYPYQIVTTEELCSTLYQSLFETSEQLVFHCSFIAKPGQRKLTQQLQALDEIYPINTQNIQISNCRGYGSLAFGVQKDDRNTVREILRLHKKSSVISETELENAFFYAAACNRLNIMKQLMKIPKIDINNPCTQDEIPLGIACKYGNENIVQLLLGDSTIKVNLKNAKGMTPLMIACESSYTQKNAKLFEMLLASGAELTLTNTDGETAYDIAKKHNNQTAINALASYSTQAYLQSSSGFSHQPSQTIPTSGTISSFFNPSLFNKFDKSLTKSSPGTTSDYMQFKN